MKLKKNTFLLDLASTTTSGVLDVFFLVVLAGCAILKINKLKIEKFYILFNSKLTQTTFIDWCTGLS